MTIDELLAADNAALILAGYHPDRFTGCQWETYGDMMRDIRAAAYADACALRRRRHNRGRPPVHRFPWDPIAELGYNDRQVAGWCGVSPGSVPEWKRRGLSVDQADRVAIALGRHPIELWPDFHEAC